MFGETGNTIGQILSLIAVVTGFISFQMKTAKGVLIFQIITALLFSAHYFLISAMTAAVLNFIGAIKCLCYYIRNKLQSSNRALPIFFTALTITTSLLTWDGWFSIFLMVGLVTDSIGFSLSNVQTIRKCTLIKSPLCLVYNICVFSIGGIIFEVSSLVSAIIGLIRGHKTEKTEQGM